MDESDPAGDATVPAAPASAVRRSDADTDGDAAQWVSPPLRGRGLGRPDAGDGHGADGHGADGDEGAPLGAPADDSSGAAASHSAAVMRWRAQSRERNAERRRAFEGKSDARKKRPWWIELPVLLVIAFTVTFLIQTFIARVYYVPSGSMETTLHGVEHGGDRILAYKLGYDFGSPEQGDVVVFKGPPSWVPESSFAGPTTWLGKIGQAIGSVIGIAPPNEKDFVKRVIAVGGQTISCCDTAGRVQVDGNSLHEPYLFLDIVNHPQWEWVDGETSCAIDPNDSSRYQSYRCFGPYKVPDGSVWVMGDHRSDSADSTWGCRGLVPGDNVQCQGPIPVDDVIGKAVAIVMPPSRWGGVGSPDIMSSPADEGDGTDAPDPASSSEARPTG